MLSQAQLVNTLIHRQGKTRKPEASGLGQAIITLSVAVSS